VANFFLPVSRYYIISRKSQLKGYRRRKKEEGRRKKEEAINQWFG
jgi:hypothetical protein